MLNLEYARLVDEDRRRVAQRRLETERLLHPDPPVTATVNEAADHEPQRHPRIDRGGVPAAR